MNRISGLLKCRKTVIGLIVSIGLILAGFLYAETADNGTLWIGQFSKATNGAELPDGWNPITFKNIEAHTQYRLDLDENRMVVRASSQSAASGLGKKVRIQAREYPLIHWSWKVTKTLERTKIGQKEGDDFPARIYISFEYDPDKATFFEKIEYLIGKAIYGDDLPASALAYVWATSDPVGTIAPNPYTDRVRMIVVESGEQNLNKWIEEERDIYNDYQKAFGKEPTAVSIIVIMTDTDNTKESTVAYYGDIYLKKRQGK